MLHLVLTWDTVTYLQSRSLNLKKGTKELRVQESNTMLIWVPHTIGKREGLQPCVHIPLLVLFTVQYFGHSLMYLHVNAQGHTPGGVPLHMASTVQNLR